MAQYDMARIAYIYLLDFCSNHNTRILIGLSPPKMWNTGNTMVLDTSSIIQLNITESYYDRQSSLVSMLSKYVRTVMGRRLLRDRLINPITDHNELLARYRMIELANSSEEKHWIFSKIRDMDRLNRKMALGTMTPAELFILNSTLETAITVQNEDFPAINEILLTIPNIQSEYINTIDIEEAGKCTVTENMQDSIFKLGYNVDIDGLSSDIRKIHRIRDIFLEGLSDLIAPDSNCCKYKEDLTGQNCYCSVTKTQFKRLESNFPSGGMLFAVDGRQYTVPWTDLILDTRNKSNVKFSICLLDNLLRQQNNDISNLRQLSISLYGELLVRLQGTIGNKIKSVSAAIGELDLYCGMFRAAKDNYYCKPEPMDKADGTGSYLDAVRLRHPLVEREHVYIPQTLRLGQEHGHGQCGILLYGVNQTGKSCTMKSVGVATVMAQAGLFVPADSFRFRPYRLLTTRILGNDNISRGLSTFAVEMIELRSILTRCNKYSLNLGDEVCHGTESASAVALVAASIRYMSRQEASFIFATHLHELSKMSEVTELQNVKHYHLTIDFDGDRIVYNRIMMPGSGLGLYGIEVAKHLKLPHDVLEDAYQIRNKYFSTTDTAKITEIRESRYSSKRVMSTCKVPDCTNVATQTHHIRHQAAGTRVEGMHKNNPDNLVPICDYHHDMAHGISDKVLVIFGYGRDGVLECKQRKKLSSLTRPCTGPVREPSPCTRAERRAPSPEP
jgi:DNA mismatch repair protein MutS